MKVKIATAVELDKVPAKMSEYLQGESDMYSDLSSKHQMCINVLEGVPSSVRCQMALELIHEIRTGMASIDQVLSDAATVLMGYAAVLEKQESESMAEGINGVPESMQNATEEDANVHEG